MDTNGLAAAFFDPQQNVSLRLRLCEEYCIMRAELTAVVEALSFANSVDTCEVGILTDFKSAVQHFVRCVLRNQGVPIAYEALAYRAALDTFTHRTGRQ